MVQQGMAHTGRGGAVYGLRSVARARHAGGPSLHGEDLTHPAAQATVAAGLRPRVLNKTELVKFRASTGDYLDARNLILLKWHDDVTRFLTEEECVAAAPAGKERMVREAYRFLHHQGCINFGVLRDDPAVPLPAAEPKAEEDGEGEAELANGDGVAAGGGAAPAEGAAAEAGEGGAAAEGAAEAKPEPTDEAVAEQLYRILEGVDLQTTSEKQLRKSLGEHFGVDMTERKGQIRELVTAYLSQGAPAWFKQKREGEEAEKRAAEEAAWRAERERKRREREERERKARGGKVVVVGAGPAGLTAALHLKRHGVEVTVLEARDRVGGRVHSYQDEGFTAPVDLGASIITGIEADVRQGLRPDPSSVLCRQLGIQLHQLGEQLPIYDTALRRKADGVVDSQVESLRDDLMDDARTLLEDLTEAEVAAMSYGQALDAALQRRLEAVEAGRRRREEQERRQQQQQQEKGEEAAAKAQAGGGPEAGKEVAAPEPAEGSGGKAEPSADAPAATPAAEPAAAGAPTEPAAAAAAGGAPEGTTPAALAAATAAAAAAPNAEAPLTDDPLSDALALFEADSAAGGPASGAAVAPTPLLFGSAPLTAATAPLDLLGFGAGGASAPQPTPAPAAPAEEAPPEDDFISSILNLQSPDPPKLQPPPQPAAGAGAPAGPQQPAAAGPLKEEQQQQQGAGAALEQEAKADGPKQEQQEDKGSGAAGASAQQQDGSAAKDSAEQQQDGGAQQGGSQEQVKQQQSEGGEGEGEEEEEEDGEDLFDITDDHLRLLHWHWANLEYGCSAQLTEISALHWNQDEEYGGFGGAHCMVVGGYGAIFRRLAALLDVRLNTPVTEISDTESGVSVTTASGEVLNADAVVVTVPLGVLKAGAIEFSPPLPPWKKEAIARLGFGDLNKVVLQFPHVFWDDSVDYFGAAAEQGSPSERGWCFMFWNFHRFSRQPTLAALVSGAAARAAEGALVEELRDHALRALRALHGEDAVPAPVACTVSRWASEEWARGSYSYVAIGASARDYDQLATPVRRRVLFAGEHTVKEHPDTVGGAMLSGLREAVRALDLLRGSSEADAAAEEAMATAEVRGGARKARRWSGGEAPSPSSSEELAGDAEARLRVAAAKAAAKRGAKARKEKRPRAEEGGGRPERRQRRESGSGGEGEDVDAVKMDALVMGRDVASVREQQRERELQREDMKVMVRALIEAEGGDLAPARAVLAGAESSRSREQLAHALRRAERRALAGIAGDAECMRLLNSWVEDSAGDTTLVGLTDTLLRALLALPLHLDVLKASGLPRTVKQRCGTHADPDTRKLATELSRKWAAAEAPAAAATAAAAPPPPTQRPGSGLAQRPGSVAGSVGTGGARAPTPQAGQLAAMELDEEAQRELEEAEAEARAAAEEAAAYAARAAELEASVAADAPSSAAESIGSFQDFKSSQGGRKRDRHQKQKSSGSGSGWAEGSGAGITDPATRKAVQEFVASVLQPMYAARRVSKEDFKRIYAKASDKVLREHTIKPGHDFLNSKRKAKIAELVEKYVAQGEQRRP